MRNLIIAGLLVTAACTDGRAPSGNTALGIARFSVAETNETSVVVGFDASDVEVARLELVHGSFMMADETSPFDHTEVLGRRLDMDVGGKHWAWQTLGFEDTTHMPAFGRGTESFAALVFDPAVKPLLDKWKIGWLSNEENAYHFWVYTWGSEERDCSAGSSGLTTDSASCPLTYQSTSLCNGGYSGDAAVTIGYDSHDDMVSQCCDTGAWLTFAQKACSTDDDRHTACGFTGNRCVPCHVIYNLGYCAINGGEAVMCVYNGQGCDPQGDGTDCCSGTCSEEGWCIN